MNPKIFKSCFEVLFKLYDDLKADCELTIGEKEQKHFLRKSILFSNKKITRMTMDEVVSFFQICCATDQPLREQCQCKIAAKKERKEANQVRDAANKKRAAAHRNNSSSTSNEKSEKCSHTEKRSRYCKLDGYDVTWNACSRHNF